jgi:hypothetical protein
MNAGMIGLTEEKGEFLNDKTTGLWRFGQPFSNAQIDRRASASVMTFLRIVISLYLFV